MNIKKVCIYCTEGAETHIQKNLNKIGYVSEIEEVSPDGNIEKNRKMLLDRSILGFKKYGFTTETNPIELRDWLQHALEESLDMANYLQAAITKLDSEKKENGN